MSTEASTMQHVFRQRSSLGLAAASGATGFLVLLSLARGWADDPRPLAAAWVVLVLSVVWSVFVRPAVMLDVTGVTLRNILRDVHIPWTRLTDVGCRWNLKVFVGDQGYTAWAITSQIERPKAAAGGMFAILPGRLDAFSRMDAQAASPAAKVSAAQVSAAKVTGAMVARSITAAKAEYDEAREQGQLPAPPDDVVRRTWVPVVMAILLLPAIIVVGLSLS